MKKQSLEYKGYKIIKNEYAGYDAVYKLNKFITLATDAKGWIDLNIAYFNDRVYNNRANEQ